MKKTAGSIYAWNPWLEQPNAIVVAAESSWKSPYILNRASKACTHCTTGTPNNERPWFRENCPKCSGSGKTAGPRCVFCEVDVFEDWQGPIIDSDRDRLAIYQPNGGVMKVLAYAESPGAYCRWLTMDDLRKSFFSLIDATPNLNWVLTTSNPGKIEALWPFGFYDDKFSWPNIWLGVVAKTQEETEHVQELLRIPATLRVLLIEPTQESDVTDCLPHFACDKCGWSNPKDPNKTGRCPNRCGFVSNRPGVDWVIVSGAVGRTAQMANVAWTECIVEQCRDANVPCFVKQLGSKPYVAKEKGAGQIPDAVMLGLRDKKGADPDEWPEDLRVREFPIEKGRS